MSEENLDGYVNLTEPFVRPGKSYFALRVRGQSMINAGILDGDLAVEQIGNVTVVEYDFGLVPLPCRLEVPGLEIRHVHGVVHGAALPRLQYVAVIHLGEVVIVD